MGVLSYKIRNNYIQQEVQVAQIEDKMRGGHLRPSEAPVYSYETMMERNCLEGPTSRSIHANL